ncbi:hypothetical protein [Treponema socranskii]|uniref:hypothetical protein n=1 Tax=Treponema socranskii TaxID=53419 RepID=UPI0028714125|nr:hypothetical protein [Treponema socranskii]MDR9858865.1 hypothetical protein [Treponema socranskii]
MMQATLKQEWKASRLRILYTSAVIAMVLLGAVLVNFIAYQTKSDHLSLFGMTMYFIGFCCMGIIPLYALVRGSGNMQPILFGDTGWLALLVPERSYAQLGARQLVNLAEYVIYMLPALLYLSFMAPTAGLLFHGAFSEYLPFSVNPGMSYVESIKQLYRFAFAEHFLELVQFGIMGIISFASWQAMFNFAMALYSAFIRTKKPNKFLIVIIIFFLFYFPMRIGTLGFDTDMSDMVRDSSFYGAVLRYSWNHTLRYAIFGAVYFLATGWLMEHKIEV